MELEKLLNIMICTIGLMDIIPKKFIKCKKIPGRTMINKINNHKNIKVVHVVGNLNSINKKYLNKKFFGKKVKNTPLPIIPENKIKNFVPKDKWKEIVLITLPTLNKK